MTSASRFARLGLVDQGMISLVWGNLLIGGIGYAFLYMPGERISRANNRFRKWLCFMLAAALFYFLPQFFVFLWVLTVLIVMPYGLHCIRQGIRISVS